MRRTVLALVGFGVVFLVATKVTIEVLAAPNPIDSTGRPDVFLVLAADAGGVYHPFAVESWSGKSANVIVEAWSKERVVTDPVDIVGKLELPTEKEQIALIARSAAAELKANSSLPIERFLIKVNELSVGVQQINIRLHSGSKRITLRYSVVDGTLENPGFSSFYKSIPSYIGLAVSMIVTIPVYLATRR